jgi:hypothetical protein
MAWFKIEGLTLNGRNIQVVFECGLGIGTGDVWCRLGLFAGMMECRSGWNLQSMVVSISPLFKLGIAIRIGRMSHRILTFILGGVIGV